MLPHNISQGVIISNHSLVLQGVSRATAGNYSCVGFNAEGDGISPPFTLNVLCKSSSYFGEGRGGGALLYMHTKTFLAPIQSTQHLSITRTQYFHKLL